MDLLNFSKSPTLAWIKDKLPTKSEPQAYHGGGNSGGNYGGQYSNGGKFPYSLSTASVSYDHRTIRRGARQMMQDSPPGRAIVERKTDSTVHTGLRLEPTPDAGILGITQEAASAWGKDVGSRFDLFASDKKQHRSEQQTFYQAQWMYSFFQNRDNDIFVRLYYSADRNLQNPLQFEFVDPDQVRGDAYTTSCGFQTSDDGIVRDDRGRETGYKIWIKNKEGQFSEVVITAKGPKSGRLFMLHGFKPEYAGQGRGFSKLAPILSPLEKYEDWTSSNIQKAINQASIVGWVEPSGDEDTVPIFNGDDNAGGFNSSSGESVTCAPDETRGDFTCQPMPHKVFNGNGIFVQDLTKGAKIKIADQNAPVTGYDKFQDAFLTSMASVLGHPLEMVHMKFGSSYNANRATLMLAFAVIEIDRAEMASDLLNPFVEMWISGEIAAGRISAPGWSDPRLKAAWLKSSWRGTGVPDIDPKKKADGVEKNLVLGTTNIERESQLHSGLPASSNIETNNRIYDEYKLMPFTQEAVMKEQIESAEDSTEGEE